MKYKITIYILLVVLGLAAIILIWNKTNLTVEPLPTISSSPVPGTSIIPSSTPGGSELIRVEKPMNNELVKSPMIIKGEARGNWYFEASFPVKIFDANGKQLLITPIQAQGEWMTTDFVPFSTSVTFPRPATDTGVLVLEKDNPSGLPENDASIEIPIRFDLDNWSDETSSACRATGCSGQICSDQEVITTCEYRDEYACYKAAKCERQENGQCGWTPTEELVACLSAAFQTEE